MIIKNIQPLKRTSKALMMLSYHTSLFAFWSVDSKLTSETSPGVALLVRSVKACSKMAEYWNYFLNIYITSGS